MGDNELLKVKFQQLHTELVGQDLSMVAERLFQAQVISAENLEDLNRWTRSGGWSTAESRRLMTLLHLSGHPRAFTELRLAISEEDTIKWIIDSIDELLVDDKLTQKVDDIKHCQCQNCGHQHQCSPAAPGALLFKRLICTVVLPISTGVSIPFFPCLLRIQIIHSVLK